MKFFLHKTSDWNYGPTGMPGAYREMLHYADGRDYREGDFIDINTLEELMALVKECDQDIVITEDCAWTDGPGIEIYDSYRE